MEILKIIAPIVTFFLGLLFTFLYWRIDSKKKKEKESVQEIAKLVNEWYEQLYDIYTNKLTVQEYYQNRKVLPILMQHIEILRNKKKYDAFVKTANEFLSIVTDEIGSENMRCCSPFRKTQDKCENGKSKDKIDVFRTDTNLLFGKQILEFQEKYKIFDYLKCNNEIEPLNLFLREIDKKLQEINISAGKILAKL